MSRYHLAYLVHQQLSGVSFQIQVPITRPVFPSGCEASLSVTCISHRVPTAPGGGADALAGAHRGAGGRRRGRCGARADDTPKNKAARHDAKLAEVLR